MRYLPAGFPPWKTVYHVFRHRLLHHRRLLRDYETTPTSAEAWIYIAMIRIQLRRLD